jgi:hypothetical protein
MYSDADIIAGQMIVAKDIIILVRQGWINHFYLNQVYTKLKWCLRIV